MQSSVYSTYHMTSAAVFYNKEDQWEVPTIDASGQAVRMTPYYTIMRLPGEHTSRVHPDAALHAAPARQPGVVAGGAVRRRALRPADGVRVPEAEARLRPAPGGGAHQPGPGDLAADHPVEPARLGGDPGHADGHSDRGVAALRAAALPARAAGPHPRTHARDRGLSELDRDGAHARRGAGPALLARGDSRPPGAAAGCRDGERRRHGAGHRHGPGAPAGAVDAAPAVPGTGPPPPPPTAPLPGRRAALPPAQLAAEAQATYQRAIEAQRAGDWAKYGAEITRLGQLLELIAKARP